MKGSSWGRRRRVWLFDEIILGNIIIFMNWGGFEAFL